MLQKADKTDDFFLPSLSKEGGAIDFERDSLENRTVFLLFFHRPFRWAVSVIYLDCRLFNRLKSWLDDVIGLEGGYICSEQMTPQLQEPCTKRF